MDTTVTAHVPSHSSIVTDLTGGDGTHSTMALECLLSAFRKLTAVSILLGQEPPSLQRIDDASQDYQAPESKEQALLYALATTRQAIHLFTESGFSGGA